MPVEDFVGLTQGTSCQVCPSLQPVIAWEDKRGLMKPENYRAAAVRYYAAGATGLSPYNYQYHWTGLVRPDHAEYALMWPEALDFLSCLRDPEVLAIQNRHYLFHPLWAGHNEGHCPTGAYKDTRGYVDCSEVGARGSFCFRMAEDLGDPRLSATLQLEVTHMVAGEMLSISLNGQHISAGEIRAQEQPGQNQSGKETGRPLGPFRLYTMPIQSPPAVIGDNELVVRLTKRVGMPVRMLGLEEVEVFVSVDDRP